MQNTLKVKVYYSDTDAEGVVYYANYLKWFEAGRTELIHQMGINLKTLREKENMVFAVKEVNCKYNAPAKLYEEITIQTKIKETTGARITFEQKAVRGSEVLVEGNIVLFALDMKKFKPVKIPPSLTASL
ncbi:MAG: YbgC/FadM family acyl-CoA thioesterase [Candidatus Margulisbacteria bacterium]|nr:YbgC/FadM family acyl-CoA thioesterase [Candidatus Margulisiibacteriota bacterium]MBU1022457.1 YbgC/FadM family acyl-CoA thioesterase [Candidatus Margulisiibacteriota bacterium]MBU1728441.1 YbgC/FadM family acyl-CoA thioesterase [Candidatus Margulisiibacteriota bacterium]MBU1954588.1 YbgC/FadM family acyl-CoA thioesterase [Candidatus Margulisiibacteriota bacterium]